MKISVPSAIHFGDTATERQLFRLDHKSIGWQCLLSVSVRGNAFSMWIAITICYLGSPFFLRACVYVSCEFVHVSSAIAQTAPQTYEYTSEHLSVYRDALRARNEYIIISGEEKEPTIYGRNESKQIWMLFDIQSMCATYLPFKC